MVPLLLHFKTRVKIKIQIPEVFSKNFQFFFPAGHLNLPEHQRPDADAINQQVIIQGLQNKTKREESEEFSF